MIGNLSAYSNGVFFIILNPCVVECKISSKGIFQYLSFPHLVSESLKIKDKRIVLVMS